MTSCVTDITYTPFVNPNSPLQLVHKLGQHASYSHLPSPKTLTTMILNAFKSPLRVVPLLLRRPLSTSAKVSNPLLSSKSTATKALTGTPALHGSLFVRGVASQVSGRPGSQTFDHAATNIKEELGNSSADLAKSIAGGNVFTDAVSPTQQTFVRFLAYIAPSSSNT